MNIQKNLYNIYKEKSRDAFTYIEVIVSLLIISLIAGVLYISYAACLKNIDSSRISVNDSIERLNTDTLIRKKIENVVIPFWIKKYETSYSSNTLTLQWINGIDKSETIIIPDNFSIVEVEQIVLEGNIPKGLIIKYEYKKNVYELKALFASRPYGKVQL